jgi:hypothetical protein
MAYTENDPIKSTWSCFTVGLMLLCICRLEGKYIEGFKENEIELVLAPIQDPWNLSDLKP